MNIPDQLKYTESHEWIRDEGDGTVTVGITDFAQEKMTELVFVELPDIDREVAASEEAAVVESVKSASDIYAPVAGTVTDTNSAVEDDPTLVNSDPYGNGWLFRLRVADASALQSLMDAAAYGKTISK